MPRDFTAGKVDPDYLKKRGKVRGCSCGKRARKIDGRL